MFLMQEYTKQLQFPDDFVYRKQTEMRFIQHLLCHVIANTMNVKG